jgi:hypothetical protein
MAKERLSKSPLTDRPLNSPGESVNRRIRDVMLDGSLFYFLMSTLLGSLAAWEWWRLYSPSKPNPVFYTLIFLVALLITVIKMRRTEDKVGRLVQGRDGEKAVGQFLEHLRNQGASIFHDIPGGTFNLDHVVIHETGIYVVETKTWSKPMKGKSIVKFDGEAVIVNGRRPDDKPINQVKAASAWLREMLEASTGRRFSIRPTVVFPGWYVDFKRAGNSKVWVLNPKQLPAFISNAKVVMSAEDVKLASFHLSRYIRTAV